MLELDAFFLNEDRHTNNIAVLYDTEKDCYELSPIFDQGLSLLADTSYDFSLEQPLEDCIKRVEAKPFHSSFVLRKNCMVSKFTSISERKKCRKNSKC